MILEEILSQQWKKLCQARYDEVGNDNDSNKYTLIYTYA